MKHVCMNKAVDLLRKCKVFFLATNEGDQPRVRPFGAVAEINGRLYMATSNTKNCFKQMIANPKVEIAAMLNNEDWIRITGTVKCDPSAEAKAEFLKQAPIPGYRVDDGVFEVLYFEKGQVEVISFAKEPECFDI